MYPDPRDSAATLRSTDSTISLTETLNPPLKSLSLADPFSSHSESQDRHPQTHLSSTSPNNPLKRHKSFQTLTPASEPPTIHTLPEELLLQIFHTLPHPSLPKTAQVCKKWGRLLRDNNLWKTLCTIQDFKPLPLPSTQQPLRCRCTSASRNCGSSTQLAFLRGQKKCNVVWKGVELSPWKAVYKQNYLTHVNWMTGRVRRRTGVSQVHRPNTFCLAFDENWAVVVSQGEPGRLVDVKRGTVQVLLDGHVGVISAVKLTQKYVLTGGIDATIRVWKINTRECIRTLLGHTGEIVAIQCDANVIATGSEDHTIRVWKTKTGEPLQVLTGHTGAVSCLQIHNNTIISGSIDHSIRIWNYTTGTCTKEIKAHSGYVYALQIHNSEIITGSSDGKIKIWALDSPTTCNEPLKVLEGHDGGVICLQVDSHKIVSGSGDYSVKVWNRKTGACLYTLNHHSATVWSLNCVGTKLMTSSFDTSLVVLDFAEEIPEE